MANIAIPKAASNKWVVGGLTPTPQPNQNFAVYAMQDTPQATPQAGSPVPTGNYQDMSATDQFKHFQANPDVGQQEIARATNQANIYKANGDMEKYGAAQDWLGKVNTVMSGVKPPATMSAVPTTPTPNPSTQRATQQFDETLGQYKQQIATPFSYDPTTDQQAQAYKKVFDNQAQEGSRNAMEAMNSRGLLNSSMTAGEIAKVQQDAGLQYGAKIADLGNQAYQRHQDQIGNQGKLVGLLGDQQQRALQGDQFNRTENRLEQGQTFTQGQQTKEFQNKIQQQHIDLANFLTQQYGVPVNPTEDPTQAYAQVAGIATVAARKIALDTQKMGFDMAIKQALAENKISTSQATIAINAAKASDLAGYHQAMAGAAQTRAGAAVTSAGASVTSANAAARNAETNASKGSAPNKNEIESSYMTNIEQIPKDKLPDFFKNEKSAIVKDLGLTGYNALKNSYLDKYGDVK